jgi:hypothetical protein
MAEETLAIDVAVTLFLYDHRSIPQLLLQAVPYLYRCFGADKTPKRRCGKLSSERRKTGSESGATIRITPNSGSTTRGVPIQPVSD